MPRCVTSNDIFNGVARQFVRRKAAPVYRHLKSARQLARVLPATFGSIPIVTRGPVAKNVVMRFLQEESGATAIEYGLIAAGISVAILTVLKGVGTKL
jgi:pilus assembly protein Flp/PilA